ncbi:hypothetical protein [Mucilaginibacter sp. KACC 22063]|uniref:hypothetical protein n=1 Tax=Mucilaginibacter sp. KACC 22063 TaxID=3025666 RepID=UPI00236723F7|nr:hypothetical protein [Mucilaginibacter sp. KACC 22063]WDF57170.1 hypothetical protein PQ461_08900 [Mucilaginibacter sp. KACC 22063]
MKILITAILIAAGLNFAPSFSYAQSTSGKITGQMKDETGKMAEVATVTLKRQQDSLIVKSTGLDHKGCFTLSALNSEVVGYNTAFLESYWSKGLHHLSEG